MKKVKIGVFGASRGTSMIRYCEAAGNAEVVAICDKWEAALQNHRDHLGDACSYYTVSSLKKPENQYATNEPYMP